MAEGKVTMVSSGAREGYTFFPIDNAQCSGCEYYGICIGGLERSQAYQVKTIRSVHHACPLDQEDMIVAEVSEASFIAIFDKKMIVKGQLLPYKRQVCSNLACPNYFYCAALPVQEGKKLRVLEKPSDVNCPLGRKLMVTKVQLA